MNDESARRLEKVRIGTLANIGDVLTHHLAEGMRMVRKAAALGYGLDSDEYARPFPGSPGPVSINIENNGSAFGKVVRALLWLLLGSLAGAGIGLGLAAALGAFKPAGSPPATVVEPKQAATSAPVTVINRTGKPVEVETMWRVEGGKLLYRIRHREHPDGAWTAWRPHDPSLPVVLP